MNTVKMRIKPWSELWVNGSYNNMRTVSEAISAVLDIEVHADGEMIADMLYPNRVWAMIDGVRGTVDSRKLSAV